MNEDSESKPNADVADRLDGVVMCDSNKHLVRAYEYTSAKQTNKHLKSLDSDERRLRIIELLTEGICVNCGVVTDECYCKYPD